MVVGETQVLGQLRAAYALAREEGTVGRALHPVAQRALRVGKRVHTETGIDRAGASLVSVALDRAEERIGSLQGRTVLVVGAGSMGALAATTLARRGAAVVVSSRTEAHAARLADSRRRPCRRARPTSRPSWPPPTCWSPAPGATGLVVGDRRRRRRAMAGRAARPLAVVDLALPRDVDPGVAALPGVHVVDLALLQGERASTPGRPTAGPVAADDIAAAHALVEAETALLRAERQAAEVAPTVSALRSQAAEVVDAELLRLSSRLPDLDARARAEIARTVRRVVDKLLHEPTVRVKELAATSGETDYAGALRALFGLGIDTPEVRGRRARRGRHASTPPCMRGRRHDRRHRHRDPAPGHPGQRAGPHPVPGGRRRDHRGDRHPGRARAHRHRGRPVLGGHRRSSAAPGCSSPRSAAPSLEGSVDLAVHSYKDLPTAPEPGLIIAAVPGREDPRDALVARDGLTLGELPPGSKVGTGAPRRVAQLRALGLGLDIVPIRGNVDTRLAPGGSAAAISTPSSSPARASRGWAGST